MAGIKLIKNVHPHQEVCSLLAGVLSGSLSSLLRALLFSCDLFHSLCWRWVGQESPQPGENKVEVP